MQPHKIKNISQTIGRFIYIIYYFIDSGDIAQLGEHLPCTQGVKSSSLFISTIYNQPNLSNKLMVG